jgi:hypothetical protein
LYICVTLFSSVTFLFIEVINEYQEREGAKCFGASPMLVGKNMKEEGDSRVSWRRPRGMGPVGFEP